MASTIIKEESKEPEREYMIIDVTDKNNSWRLEKEIEDSNCKIVNNDYAVIKVPREDEQ